MKTNPKLTERLHISEFFRRLMSSRIFIQNFLFIAGLMLLVFFAFALIVYRYSANILTREFTASNQYQLEATAQSVDDYLMDMRNIIASIDTDDLAKGFFTHENPELIYSNFYTRIEGNLESYKYSHAAIDSIYMYSGLVDSVLTDTGHSHIQHFSDTNWMEHLTEGSSDIQVFFRAINDYFPYVLCIMKPLDNHTNAIVLNLNLSNLSFLKQAGKDPYQEIFLISDQGELLYRNMQRELTEPLSVIPELKHFKNTNEVFSELITEANDSYVYSQVHSKHYPWSYVTVTHLEEYTSDFSVSSAFITALLTALFVTIVLAAFLFSVRSVKPIHNLLSLLKNPQESISREFYKSDEIRYIADQITGYIHQNRELSDELSVRLNLLNETRLLALQSQINPHFLFNTLNMIHIQESEILGYDHALPAMTLKLSKLLRYALESTDLVELQVEMQYTKIYISILQARYNKKPQVLYHIAEEALSAKVPKLFIQPIIENAIFHGLAEDMSPESTLTLSCLREEDICVIRVTDNGVGMNEETLRKLKDILHENAPVKGSIGLRNVINRMHLLYGDDFILEIESKLGIGSTFTLRFPFRP